MGPRTGLTHLIALKNLRSLGFIATEPSTTDLHNDLIFFPLLFVITFLDILKSHF